MSLYRTYRPRVFADVIGQDHVVTTLEHAIAQDKLAHAYLFAGSRGTGKTSVARILAKAMLTKGMTDEKLKAQVGQGVDDGSIVDLIEIDAASNRGIDDIRTLVEKIQFSPVVAGAKVYIIDEAHMLTKEAFNALLKTLEEPPAYAYFILATTELQKIPATIQSRCQRFTFRHITDEDLVRGLQKIIDSEHIEADRAALRAIAHAAGGGMRDAISLLDQLRSLEKIDVTDVKQRIGETGLEYVEQIFDAVAARDKQTILDLIRKIEDAGIPLDIFTRELLTDVRNRLHAAIKENQSSDALATALERLLAAIRDIRIAPVPGLVLEAALLSLCQDAPSEGSSKKNASPSAHKVPSAAPQSAPSFMTTKQEPSKPHTLEEKKEETSADPEPFVAALVEAPEFTLDTIKEAWLSILEEAKPASVKMSLKNARVSTVDDKSLTLIFTSRFHRDRVGEKAASYAIEDILQRIFKRSIRLECMVDEDHAATLPDTAQVNLADAVAEVF